MLRLLLLQQQENNNGKCAMIRDAINSCSVAMMVFSMVVLAVLLVIYYFRSEMTGSPSTRAGPN